MCVCMYICEYLFQYLPYKHFFWIANYFKYSRTIFASTQIQIYRLFIIYFNIHLRKFCHFAIQNICVRNNFKKSIIYFFKFFIFLNFLVIFYQILFLHLFQNFVSKYLFQIPPSFCKNYFQTQFCVFFFVLVL